MGDFLEEKRIKVSEFFSRLKAKEDDVEIKMESGRRLKIKAKKWLFPRDRRLLPADSDVYEFELSCFYRKDASGLEMTFSTRIKVEESRIPDMNSANFTVFDDFVKAIGLGGFDKNVQFDAVYSDGQTLFDNTCEAYWMKTLKIKSAPNP